MKSRTYLQVNKRRHGIWEVDDDIKYFCCPELQSVGWEVIEGYWNTSNRKVFCRHGNQSVSRYPATKFLFLPLNIEQLDNTRTVERQTHESLHSVRKGISSRVQSYSSSNFADRTTLARPTSRHMSLLLAAQSFHSKRWLPCFRIGREVQVDLLQSINPYLVSARPSTQQIF